MYTLFVPARAHLAFPCFDQPDLKARWTLALDIPAGWQALANGAETARAERGRADQAARSRRRRRCSTYLFAFAAGRFSDRDRRAQRPDVPDVPPRDRRREGRAQPRRDLRSACRRARVARALHRHRLSVGQVRFPAGAVVPVRRHGARRRDLLQRVRAPARSVGHAEPEARARQRHRPRDRAHVVRRPGDDAVVQRRVDEGSLRQLHGGEDRQPVVPGDQPRAAVPATRTTRRPTTSTARPAPTRSASALDNLDEAGSLYGAIIYQKAPIVMRQLERILGEDAFRDGLREYSARRTSSPTPPGPI